MAVLNKRVVRLMSLLLLALANVNGNPQFVSESERMIPLSYDVDVIVVGGTTRCGGSRGRCQGSAKVFLSTDRPYLGEDVCAAQRLWIKADSRAKTTLGQHIYGDASGAIVTDNGYRVVRPMDVKRKLDEALINPR